VQVNSVALGAAYSAVLSNLNIDVNGPVGYGLSVGQTSSDTFNLYGTLDPAATDNANAFLIAAIAGGAESLPRDVAERAKSWPYLLLLRTGGVTAGSFYSAGNPAASPAPVTTAAPVVAGDYSALLTMTTLGAKNIRIGASRQMTASDSFDVYVSNDSALASLTGAEYAGRIYGGGGANLNNTVVVSGYNYAIIRRVAGSTAGNVIAAGVSPASGGGGNLNLTTLLVGDTAVNGTIGALTAAATVDIYSSFRLTQTTAGITAATLPNPTDTTPGKVASVMNNDTSTFPLQMYGMTLNVGATLVFQWDGSAWLGPRTISQGGNSFGAGIAIGSTDNQAVAISSGTGPLSVGNNADDHTTRVGGTTGASPLRLEAGTSGISMNGTGAGGVTVTPGATGAVNLQPRAAGAGNTTELRLLELAASGVNYTGFKAPDALGADAMYTLPTALPTIAGQQLESTTGGVLSWGGVVSVVATNASAQNFVDGDPAADVANWTEVTDTAAAFVPATGVFTVPAGQGGLYMFSVSLQWAATAAALGVTFTVSLNSGGIIRSAEFVNPVATLTQARNVVATWTVQLAAAATVTIQGAVSANGGTDIALTNSALFNTLSISRLSA
jgi:hypothetical protein